MIFCIRFALSLHNNDKGITMFKKNEFHILINRLSEPRGRIQVVSGPRQVGKSTMVKQVLKEIDIPYMFVTGDNVDSNDNQWISETWQTARSKKMLGKYSQYLLVIDEVHKIDNWSEAVKKEWDLDTFNDLDMKVVLLGSSRLLLKDGLTESLAGRYEIIRMTHWTYPEMHEAFGLDVNQYIYYGGYPGGASLIKDERRWCDYIKDSIIAPAISQDILMTKTVYKPDLIKQVFDLGCAYSGEELSLNKMLGQLQDAGNVTTIANYLSTLDEAQLLAGLQKFAFDKARKYNSVPKLMVYNTALLSALSNVKFEKAFVEPKMWGRWVESAVGAYLLNMSEQIGYHVFYWRERNDEVDFILECNRSSIAIEVKSGRRTTNVGLSVFREKFHPVNSFVVGSGGITVEEFLSSDLGNLF